MSLYLWISAPAYLGRKYEALHLPLLRVPVLFEIGDQRRAEVAIGLLARVDRHVAAELVERVLGHTKRATVAGRADDSSIGEPRHHAVERRVHLARRDDLVADRAA